MNNISCFSNNWINQNLSIAIDFGTCFVFNDIIQINLTGAFIQNCFSNYTTTGIILIYSTDYYDKREFSVFIFLI